MSDTEPDVPPIPLPPTAAVPPVEPAPAAPPVAPPVAPGYVAPGYVAPPAPGYTPPPVAPGGYPGAPTGYAGLPPARPQGLAITSIILGIASLVVFPLNLALGIAAVVTGHLAQKRQPWARGLSITGLITGYIGILFGLIVTLVVILGIAGAFNDSSYSTY